MVFTQLTNKISLRSSNKAAHAIQAVFDQLGLPKITDEEVEAATYANSSKDMPDRSMVEDMKAAQELLDHWYYCH